MAKPNIPIAGATMLPDVEASTNKKPIIGKKFSGQSFQNAVFNKYDPIEIYK